MFSAGKSGAWLQFSLCLAILGGIQLSYPSQAQTPSAKPQDPATSTPTAKAPATADKPVSDKSATDKPLTDKQKKEADQLAQRQKELTGDTAKLLTLANELKAEMDKSTKDTLSLSVVKKADEVEKLAHKVRDEMKKSMGN